MLDLLEYSFFQNAIIASVLIAIACGITGTYIVSKRIVFISGGITHASFGGLGIGFYFGINPLFSALAFATLAAFGVEYLSRSDSFRQIREDSVIAAIWSLGMAIGIIFLFLTPGYSPNLSAYLFGSILTISTTDILCMEILALLLIFVYILCRKLIIYIAFDRDFALVKKLPVRFIEYIMMLFIAATIVISIRLIGIMLLLSLVTLPQITANLFTSNYNSITIASCFISFIACIVGLLLSYYLNIPSGAVIVIILILFFLLSKLILFLHYR